MKVLICGSRGFDDSALIRNVLSPLNATLVIHGGARGADQAGGFVAEQLGIDQVAYPANWTKYGRSAGFRRNEQMLDEAKPDLVLAFYAGTRTPGTAHTVAEAKKRGIEVREYGL